MFTTPLVQSKRRLSWRGQGVRRVSSVLEAQIDRKQEEQEQHDEHCDPSTDQLRPAGLRIDDLARHSFL
jgi:hypothetical protein